MTRTRVVLIGLLAVALGILGLFRYQEQQAANRSARELEQKLQIARSLRVPPAAKAQEQSLSRDLALESALPKGYPRPASAWIDREKAFFAKKLQGTKYDLLVLPFQVDGYAFNRATRATMSALLVDAIARASGAKLPDPFVVSKALGDGQRSFKAPDIQVLADSMGVDRVVAGFVGHDTHGRMSLTVTLIEKGQRQSWNLGEATEKKRKSFSNLEFTDEDTPVAVFERIIPELLSTLEFNSLAAQSKPLAKMDMNELPVSLKTLFALDDNPARASYVFQLLAALTPRYLEASKDRFRVKAYLALQGLSEASPEYRVLRARAYLGLGYRSAALKAVSDPQTDEEREIVAVLSGKLALVSSLVAKETNPLKRLLQYLDQNRIEVDYELLDNDRARSTAEKLTVGNSVWSYLVTRKLIESDAWVQLDNLKLKALLDKELPVAGFSLEKLLAGVALTDHADRAFIKATLSVNEHLQRYWEDDPSHVCCERRDARPSDLDLAELFAAIGHDNIIRRIDFAVEVQGRPDEGLELVNSIDSVYHGFPYFSLQSARAKNAIGRKSGGIEAEGLLAGAQDDALNAAYWEQGQSLLASEALVELSQADRLKYGYFGNLYSPDFPFHPLYVQAVGLSRPEPTIQRGLAAIDNATSEFNAIRNLVDSKIVGQDGVIAKQVADRIANRFIECPARNRFLAEVKQSEGDLQNAIALYRESIKQAPNFGNSYMGLGVLLHETGNPSEAAKVFLGYPKLRTSDGSNRVGIANRAYEMGNYFYQSGDLEFAKLFYKIAAAQDAGASADLSAALRLKLLDGDIEGAAEGMLRAAQRYRDASRFRDFFGVLHAMGNSEQAWAGFEALVGSLNRPQLWETALVGHHKERKSEQDVLAWVNQPQFKNAANEVSYAAEYAARFATTDRIPSSTLGKAIAEMDLPTWKLERTGETVRHYRDGMPEIVLGPIVEAASPGTLQVGVFESVEKHSIRSDLAYFVEGYRNLKQQNFSQAKAIFDEAASLYDLSSARSSYLLPYYAIAATKAGDVAGLEKILSRFRANDRRFDYQLARTAIAAIAGNLAEALQALQLARYRRPNTYDRPLLTEYTFADVCETLYVLTNKKQFRDTALEWAKIRQRTEPWHSWTYAFEAALTTDPVSRKRALAYAYFLDSNSEHLSHFSKSEIESAVKEFGEPPPFRKREKERPSALRT